MAKFRKIDPRIWNDLKFMNLSERAKLVFFFVLTSPQQTMLGAMRATPSGLTAELRMPLHDFSDAFLEIAEQGMLKFDERAAFIWLPNWFRYNRPESPSVVKAWPAAVALLPECSLKLELLQRIKQYSKGLPKGFRDAVPTLDSWIDHEIRSLTGGLTSSGTGAGVGTAAGEGAT